jgi:hypothetical protein
MNPKLTVAAGALAIFAVVWLIFRIGRRGEKTFFFDPKDCFKNPPPGRVLSAAAENTTFEPMLKNYLATTQLLVTVAAASIAFGGNTTHDQPVSLAKLVLACSIFFGVVFCALLLWRYDEYTQDLHSYSVGWYSTTFAAGMSSLICFMGGYIVWGFAL